MKMPFGRQFTYLTLTVVVAVCSILLFVFPAMGKATKSSIAREDSLSSTQYSHEGYIITSIPQLAEPLSQIIGDCKQVRSLLTSGTDPHLYRLSRADVLEIHRADSVIYVGHLLESQMHHLFEEISHRKDVYAIAEAYPGDLMFLQQEIYDPHLWMDPLAWGNVIKEITYDILGQILEDTADDTAQEYPACGSKILENLASYLQKIDAMDKAIAELINMVPYEARVLVTSHDAFGYFGRRYGVEVLAIQGISTDREVSLNRISRLVDFVIDNEVRAVFTETSVSSRDIMALVEGAAQRGHKITVGGSLYSDSMGGPGTEAGSYLGMLSHNVETILRGWGLAEEEIDIYL